MIRISIIIVTIIGEFEFGCSGNPNLINISEAGLDRRIWGGISYIQSLAIFPS